VKLPEGVLLTTVGVDVQARYIVALTCGWSFEGEAWLLDFEKTEADPRDEAVWRGLAGYLNALRFEHANGDMWVHLLGIDSGFLTDHVYNAVRLANAQPGRGGRWAYATKGVGALSGEPLLLPVRDERDAHGRRGLRPLRINTDEAKSEFYAMLAVRAPGPGFVHIPRRLGVGTDLLAELTSEEARPKFDPSGATVGTVWAKKTPDGRNEALDTAIIGLALFHHVSKSQWLDLLVKRFGQGDGVARFRARHPTERIHGIDTPPRREPTGWLARRRA
jgi:phage terminase large subunit GpA-like protein